MLVTIDWMDMIMSQSYDYAVTELDILVFVHEDSTGSRTWELSRGI